MMIPRIRMMQSMVEKMAKDEDNNEKFNAEDLFDQALNREWRKEYYNNYVWSGEFWEYPLLQCLHTTPLSGKMDPDDFLFTKQPLHVRLSPKQLEKAASKGEIRCPGCEDCPDKTCKAVFKIVKDMPRYLWMDGNY
jgi:hypothetical protein